MSGLSVSSDRGLEIAIIGMAGRFPGANNIEQFWLNLRDGVESVSFFTDQELDASGVSPDLYRDPSYVRGRPVLEGIDLFDASFFGFSPREAEITDPQHRLFLEAAWQTLENAGYDPDSFNGLIGVYAGSGTSSYFMNIYSNPNLTASLGKFQIDISNDKDYLATKVSYKLNLRGPSVSVQTACSTSLVATHLACQGLLSGECDMALAGGVTVWTSQKVGYPYTPGSISSPDGHCRAFDSNARGTIGGNGVALLLLKRLDDALADRDFIHAVIKGSAINNDGGLKVGYTAPRLDGQAEVIRAAHIAAAVEPDSISYVEAHGTATELGDPIEVAALTRAFRLTTHKKQFCALGSVKTNIGHLDAAAGAAGLIKAVLSLRHRQLPPSLNFSEPNPKIDFLNSPFFVNTSLTPWGRPGQLLRAGVSSFGIGGTNAHLVVEQAPDRPSPDSSRGHHLLVLSAKNEQALREMSRNLAEHLSGNAERLDLADAAYTLQVGRRHWSHRRALACRDIEQALSLLRSDGPLHALAAADARPPLAFMFSGQGSQYPNMGLGLYNNEPAFRRKVDDCCLLLTDHLGFDLREVLYPDPSREAEANERMLQTEVAQPALLVVELALAELLMSWGIRPTFMIGHSLGEFAAASLSGVISEADALRAVAARGRLMQRQQRGAMMAVGLGRDEAEQLLDDGLEIAAVNGPRQCVISGADQAIERLAQQLTARGVSGRTLQTSHAFHSRMMSGAAEAMVEHMKGVKLSEPRISYLSNVTGGWIRAEEATDPAYWGRHMTGTVEWERGLMELLKQEGVVLLEVGPGEALCAMARQALGREGRHRVVRTMRKEGEQELDDQAVLVESVGRLWSQGADIDWEGFNRGWSRRREQLPGYAFQRQSYWVERCEAAARPRGDHQQTALSKTAIQDWFFFPSWKRSRAAGCANLAEALSESNQSWLIFADTSGLGGEVAERLRQVGQHVVVVKAGESFIERGEGEYELNPAASGDYDALLKRLDESGKIPREIIHLWSVDREEGSQEDKFARSQRLGFQSLIYLAQAIGRQVFNEAVKLQVVTNGMQEVLGSERLRPEKAIVVGPCKVIPQEYPNITCRSIDITLPESNGTPVNLINQLLAEFVTDSNDLVVAYRVNKRWIQTFEPARPHRLEGGRTPLRVGGVYLITGGLGQIGLTLAQYLAATLQARLVLTGRSRFPASAAWDQWLASHDESDEVSRKIRALQSIEKLGGEVMVLEADVADLIQMRKVIEKTFAEYGVLNGVIHAAGIVGKQSAHAIQETGEGEFQQHAEAKVRGAYVLEEVLRGRQLDFCVLMSSLATVLGGLGFAAYSAANSFLDGFAHEQNRKNSTPWVSVNWDGWRIGAGRERAGAVGTMAELGMTAEEGTEVFRRVLSMDDASQVVISTGDLHARINQWVRLETLRDDNKAGLSRQARPEGASGAVAPRSQMEESLVKVWEELLGVEPIGVEDNFFELGGHSLLVIQVMSRIRDLYRVELPIGAIFDAPTIAQLAVMIVQSQMGEVDDEEFAKILAEIELLSDEEAAQSVPSKATGG